MEVARKKVSELKRFLNEKRNEITLEGGVLISEAFKEMFDTYPELESYKWAQYTPYFNDGDECKFGVDCDYPSINGIDWWQSSMGEEPAWRSEVVNLGRKILRTLSDEELNYLFGDHISIELRRVENTLQLITEDYDHE